MTSDSVPTLYSMESRGEDLAVDPILSPETALASQMPTPQPSILAQEQNPIIKSAALPTAGIVLLAAFIGYFAGQSNHAPKVTTLATAEVAVVGHDQATSGNLLRGESIASKAMGKLAPESATELFDKISTKIKRANLEIADTIPSSEAAPLILQGDQYFREGKFIEAGVHYKRALKSQPNLLSARLSLGVCFLKIEKLDLALKEFQLALQLDPNYAASHYNLAAYYALANDTPNSLRHLSQAIALQPRSGGLAATDPDFANLQGQDNFAKLTLQAPTR